MAVQVAFVVGKEIDDEWQELLDPDEGAAEQLLDIEVQDECRVPVDGKVVVARTRDDGESFEVPREGLPRENAYDVVFRHSFDIDASGDVLAMGSTTGSLWLTEDQGDSWSTLSNYLPPIYCLRFG